MSKRKIAIIIIVLISIFIIFLCCWKYFYQKSDDNLVLYGNVDIRQVELAFRVGGKIEEIFVDEGYKVEKGQPLAKLVTDILEQQVDQAQAQLNQQEANLIKLEKGYRVQEIAQARASVSSARASAENASINLNRISGLKRSNAVSQKDLDNAVAAEREAKAALRSSEEQLNMLMSGYREEEILAQKAIKAAAMASLEKAKIQLSDAILHAPQPGIILTKAREAGAIINEGQTVLTLTLVNPVWLIAYISEPDLGKITPGMKVEAAIDSFPDKRFPGTIGFISPTAEFTPKTVQTEEVRTHLVYKIRVQVEDADNVMRQGMPVTIYIPKTNS